MQISDLEAEDGVAREVEIDQEPGMRAPIKMVDPKLPSQDEVDEHCLTHLPYRNWCRHCVRGKGRAADHKTADRQDGLPEVHMDYCFMSMANGEMDTIIVVRERSSRMTMATVVPLKGASNEFVARRVLAFIKELGLETSPLVLKSDQEPAIADVLDEVARRRTAKTVGLGCGNCNQR